MAYFAGLYDKTGVGGAYCHVNHSVFSKFFDRSWFQGTCYMLYSFVPDTSHLTDERLTLVETKLVVLVAIVMKVSIYELVY